MISIQGVPIMLRAMLGVVAVAAAGAVVMAARPSNGRAADDAELRKELQALAQRAILFGHQSVGVNLLDGLRRLAARSGVPLRIEDVTTTAAVPPGTLAHVFVPENGNPGLKLQSFGKAISSAAPGGVDVALLKFCYIDFAKDTDARALFAKYQEAAAGYRKAQPGATLVHVTVPLTTVAGGFKAWVKGVLGRPRWGEPENARREEFNALLRGAYQGKEPIFDLALVESTRPDGRRETISWEGRTVPVLVAAYSDDGGHLNELGQDLAARALVSTLARAAAGGPSRPAP
jgi:hypothetical protein